MNFGGQTLWLYCIVLVSCDNVGRDLADWCDWLMGRTDICRSCDWLIVVGARLMYQAPDWLVLLIAMQERCDECV